MCNASVSLQCLDMPFFGCIILGSGCVCMFGLTVVPGCCMYEQAQVLASAWAEELSVQRLAVSHCLVRLETKQTSRRLDQHALACNKPQV